jgi:adenylate cyclase class IV
LKDIAGVRAKFEARKAASSAYNQTDIVELLLENASFEEEQNQVQKSRKLYDTLTLEVAPGHIKSIIAYAAFERRMNNNEKAKDLYLKAFDNALAREDAKAVVFVSMLYARFCVFECSDIERAC